jgi:putative component of membrane protein insertase Oxa1/YidC/SpoIIIJ protein YidD
MKYKNPALYFLLVALSITFINNSAISQGKKDFELLNDIFDPHIQKTNYVDYMKGNSNEFQVLASGFFLFYKSFVSSQDGNHCVFHPSCSVYTIQSIKLNGLLIGIPDGIDRLSRCNRLSPENYERFETTNLYFDPVWDKHEKK